MGGILNARGPHPHYDHLVPLTNGATSPGCYSGVPLASMMLGALLMERCATCILVVGEVLEHCFGYWLCLEGGAFGGASDCRSFALVERKS